MTISSEGENMIIEEIPSLSEHSLKICSISLQVSGGMPFDDLEKIDSWHWHEEMETGIVME